MEQASGHERGSRADEVLDVQLGCGFFSEQCCDCAGGEDVGLRGTWVPVRGRSTGLGNVVEKGVSSFKDSQRVAGIEGLYAV